MNDIVVFRIIIFIILELLIFVEFRICFLHEKIMQLDYFLSFKIYAIDCLKKYIILLYCYIICLNNFCTTNLDQFLLELLFSSFFRENILVFYYLCTTINWLLLLFFYWLLYYFNNNVRTTRVEWINLFYYLK